ncbi:MAG: c-type cytochrome [Acidobacteriia bacterium]|nr:c-type cytochrome [Terriglobia bacterium]
MRITKSVYGFAGVLSLVLASGFTVSAQDVPDVGPHPPQPMRAMESHIGKATGHANDGKMNFRRYCAGCHGDLGDGNGENAQWIDPKPRDFTIATFKCRSTPTGTLPTDQDLYNSIGRGFTNSNMPIWNTFDAQQRADLVAYIKTFSARWEKEKAGETLKIPPEPTVTIDSIAHGKALFTKLECWKCHGPQGKGDGPSAATLTDSKDQPIRPYNFADGKDDSRFKCGSTNQDIYKIFMTGVDGTPMPSFADVIQPNDAWDLVHFLRTLQVHRHSKENDVLAAAHGVIPPYVEKPQDNPAPAAQPENKPPSSGGH